MNGPEDVVTLGLSTQAHSILKRLKDQRYFAEMVDAFRFAIAYSIACDIAPADQASGGRQTIFNVGTLDPDGSIRAAVSAICPEGAKTPYRLAERLAEAGILALGRAAEDGTLSLVDLVHDIAV